MVYGRWSRDSCWWSLYQRAGNKMLRLSRPNRLTLPPPARPLPAWVRKLVTSNAWIANTLIVAKQHVLQLRQLSATVDTVRRRRRRLRKKRRITLPCQTMLRMLSKSVILRREGIFLCSVSSSAPRSLTTGNRCINTNNLIVRPLHAWMLMIAVPLPIHPPANRV